MVILYISFDGILEPLGYSQIVRVVLGLAERGHEYVILSLERPRDLHDRPRVEALREQLRRAGVDWLALPFESGSARSALTNLRRATAAALKIAWTRKVRLVHARSYQPAFIALALHKLLHVPFLFDARGYWIDERLDEARWFTNPHALAVARALERRLFTESTAVVTLTELQADDVRQGRFGRSPQHVLTIPTCADFDDFQIGPLDTSKVSAEVAERLAGKLVLGFIGAVNVSYLMPESLRLAKYVLELRADAQLLALTRQTEVFRELLRKANIDERRATILSVPHDSMPSWMKAVDWGLLLLRSSAAKRASMPTKFAEFLASGVRPIFYGCNEEVAHWVSVSGSGLVLDSIDDAGLQAGARLIASRTNNLAELEHARRTAAPHFSLRSGIERYDTLLRSLPS